MTECFAKKAPAIIQHHSSGTAPRLVCRDIQLSGGNSSIGIYPYLLWHILFKGRPGLKVYSKSMSLS